MGMFLMIIGFGWAMVGVANIAMTFNTPTGAFVFIVNMVLFILPGIVTGAIGWRMKMKADDERQKV